MVRYCVRRARDEAVRSRRVLMSDCAFEDDMLDWVVSVVLLRGSRMVVVGEIINYLEHRDAGRKGFRFLSPRPPLRP